MVSSRTLENWAARKEAKHAVAISKAERSLYETFDVN